MFHEALEAAFVRPEALATSTAVASPLPHGARLATLDDTPVALPLCSQPRISADHQATLSWLLVRRGEWGALSARELRRLAVHVEIHDIPVTRTQLILIRRSLLHARFGPTELSLAHEASAELRQRYEGGERLLNLAREYDFPPVIVMRAILAARGLSREQAKRALAAPADELNARDAAHAREARSNDLLFGTAAEHEAALAPDVDGDARVRAALCRLLDACGVRYTVGGMRAPAGGAGGAGGAGYGATRFADLAAPQLGVQVDDVPIEHLEPQILLHSAAQLNGVRVHWCMVRPMHASSNDAPFVRHQVCTTARGAARAHALAQHAESGPRVAPVLARAAVRSSVRASRSPSTWRASVRGSSSSRAA